MEKFGSIVLKMVIEIDGVETVFKNVDYTDSMNNMAEEYPEMTEEDVKEMIMEDITLGEVDF